MFSWRTKKNIIRVRLLSEDINTYLLKKKSNCLISMIVSNDRKSSKSNAFTQDPLVVVPRLQYLEEAQEVVHHLYHPLVLVPFCRTDL